MVQREQDHYLWSIETARTLRQGDLRGVDALALAEELEWMSNTDRRELGSRITQIMEHLLKLKLETGQALTYNQGVWQGSISRQQAELELLLEESPSLKALLTEELLEKCYRIAARLVAKKPFQLEAPQECPFDWAEILGESI